MGVCVVCYNMAHMSVKVKHRSSNSLLMNYLDSSDRDQETKFDLYVQSRKVRQIAAALDQFTKTTSLVDSQWFLDDQAFISQLVDELLDDLLLVLDGVQLDSEAVELSVSLMSDIKRALSVVEQIADSDQSGDN